MDTSVETLITIAALEVKYFWEVKRQSNVQFKIVMFVLRIVSAQNVNLDILSQIKTVHKFVHNATTQTVLNVKIMLVIVKHVFTVTHYISLNKFVKSQQFLIVSQLSMEGAELAMMDTKLLLISPVKSTVKLLIVRSVRMINLVQNASLDLILLMLMEH